MYDGCKNVGLPEQEYGTDGLFFWITFMRPNSDSRSDRNSDSNSDRCVMYQVPDIR